MPVLAHHDSITGPLTAADLEAARRNNPGSIWHPHRYIPGRDTCNGSCQSASGCDCHSAYCAPEGGTFADPVPSAVYSMRRHDRIRYRVALALLVAVAAYLSHIAWPLVAA